MAEELSVSNPNNEMLELSICQPDHPNQAVFVSDLITSLQDFRAKISESTLVLPESWLFMTRAGSLISNDQEENLQVNTITREREDSTALDVLITPSQYYQRPPQGNHPRAGANGNNPRAGANGNNPRAGANPLSSFATIIAALRDVYVTSIQPNMHELIKPLIIATGAAAVLSFILALILALSIGAMGGLNRSLLVPFFRQHLCGEQTEMTSELPKLYRRINELETRLNHVRQVEVGSLTCKEDNHMYEETDITTLTIPFRKSQFASAPRVTFALREVSVDDPHSVRLEDLKVNSTGFSVRCSYFGKWMHYNIQYTWIAVGN